MKSKFIFSLFFILICFLSFAKEDDPLSDIISLKTFQADFIQVNTIKNFGNDEYKGHVVISSGDKALWDYKEPSISWYLFSKDRIEQYDGDNNQLIILEGEEASSTILLQILLDIKKAKETFTIKREGNILTLSPISDMGIKSIVIILQNGIISEMKSSDGMGNLSHIVFTNTEINKKLKDGVFDRKAPKNAEIFKQKK